MIVKVKEKDHRPPLPSKGEGGAEADGEVEEKDDSDVDCGIPFSDDDCEDQGPGVEDEAGEDERNDGQDQILDRFPCRLHRLLHLQSHIFHPILHGLLYWSFVFSSCRSLEF